MTEAERDLLASVYLDGEATPNEVAQVERDPELLARVDTFRTVRDTVSARAAGSGSSTAIKEQHLSAALGAFDSQPRVPAAPVQASTSPAVVDLTTRRRDNEATTSAKRGERLSLLAAAAGAMVLLVGGVFLASQVGGSDDSSVAMDLTAAESTDDAAEMIEPAADSDADFMDEAVGEAAEEEAMEEEAVDSEAALSATEPRSAAETDGADSATANTQAAVGDAEQEFAEDNAADEEAPTTTTTLPDIRRDSLPDEGFFPQEPVVIYPTQPSGQDLVDDLTLVWRDPDSSLCGATYAHPDNALLIAYLPVEIAAGPDGQPQVQEALYYTFNNDVEVVLVVRETCQPT